MGAALSERAETALAHTERAETSVCRTGKPYGCAGGAASGRDSALAVSDANRVGASR
jgi:hypothetical protein